MGEISKVVYQIKESARGREPTKKNSKPKQKSQMEPSDKEEQEHPMELTIMDIDTSKEDLSAKELILNFFLHEWRNLDDRFIMEDQKKLY